MTEFVEKLIDDIVAIEGGYVDNPNDRGGKTKHGITEAVARANGYEGDMRDLPLPFARAIYRRQYFEDPGFDKVAALSEKIAEEMTDTGVNMGQDWASRFLQRALNAFNKSGTLFPDMPVDGAVGPTTLEGLRLYLDHRGAEGVRVMLKALNCLQGERYLYLAEAREKNEDFVFGWIRARI